MDIKPYTCRSCGGDVVERHDESPDLRGHCEHCGAYYVEDERESLATKWCECGKVDSYQLIYYFSDDGSHGWLHSSCGQIVQTG